MRTEEVEELAELVNHEADRNIALLAIVKQEMSRRIRKDFTQTTRLQ